MFILNSESHDLFSRDAKYKLEYLDESMNTTCKSKLINLCIFSFLQTPSAVNISDQSINGDFVSCRYLTKYLIIFYHHLYRPTTTFTSICIIIIFIIIIIIVTIIDCLTVRIWPVRSQTASN